MGYETYETIATVVCIGLFVAIERVRPFSQPTWRQQIRLDLAGFAVLLLGLNLTRLGVGKVADALDASAFETVRELPIAARFVFSMVAIDLALYLVHRAMHSRRLWPTHRWHHSPSCLYWLSGFRTSLLHAFIYVTPQVLIPFYVFDLSAAAAGALFAIGVILQFWQHANVNVDTRLLEWVLVTPRYHRIHHALEDVEPRNLANVFTWWDRLLGTYADPATYGEGYRVGTPDQKSPARMMLGV